MSFSTGIICSSSVSNDPLSLYEMIQAENAESNLIFCLDVADSSCYSGTGQILNDLSGNGLNFYRGLNGNVNTYNPTFHGTAGNKSANEYLSFDGTDRIVSSSNTTKLNKMVSVPSYYTLAITAFFPNSGNSTYSVLSRGSDSYRKYEWIGPGYGGVAYDGYFYFKDRDDGGDPGILSYGVWSMVFHRMDYDSAINANYANAHWKTYINGTFSTGSNTYMDYYAAQTSQSPVYILTSAPNGTLFSNCALWDRGLSDSEMTAIYNRMKLRFTSLP